MATILLEDIGNKNGLHNIKHAYWEKTGVMFERFPLPAGDYVLYNNKISDVIQRKNKRGIALKKMDFVGTYDVCVDTKRDIEELLGDVIGKDHERFRDELIFCQNNGIKLYILVENKGGVISCTDNIFNETVRSLDDLFRWKNPRLFIMKPSNEVVGYYKNGKPKYKRVQKYPKATKGEILAKACITMQNRYGCEFLFCTPEESGSEVIRLLTEYDTKEV